MLDIIVAISLSVFIKDISLLFIVIILLIIASLVLLYFIGSKRRRELEEIKGIINSIRTNKIADPNEIRLSESLSGLQEVIKKMFEKTKGDIEYLQRLERIRTEFLANVSHELRTPIFAIQGYIETLLNGAINDNNVNINFLEKANNHTLNLNNLLNDLIDISMIESGEMKMSFRYFNINEYLKGIVQDLMPMAEEKNIKLIYHQVNDRLQLFGDKNKLRQALVNLIQNAIKYTETGQVEVFVEDEPKYARIIVKDSGFGIAEEDLSRIFERFYRVDKARSRAVGGTGLGLAIVKHIIEAHGSKIEVSSKVDIGSEFSFKLKK
ncbi:MAG TPA: ATP-binding protein [Ignavibacteriaceae bacterium]|nr:ATP-binding protein [Ignavibacteriaceae bacterium]